MLELQLDLPPLRGRRAAIEHALRDAIRTGRLQGGSRLPSSRVLAADLGVSRATVVGAFEQLTAEGFLVSEHGRATTVAHLDSTEASGQEDDVLGPNPVWDFRPGEPDAGSFPRRAWLRSVRQVVVEGSDDVFAYPDPRGRPELRIELARHMARTRSVAIESTGVYVTGGFAASLGFLAETFRRLGITTVAVEQAMFPFHRAVLRSAGLQVDTIPVDRDGLVVDELAHSPASAVVVTPANQYPFAVTMSPERRTQLVAWAEQRQAWIVEDDYDGEFRYDRRPIGALQALAPNRVVYCGTASKTLAAGIRLGWMALPEQLRRPVLEAVNVRAGVSSIDQLAFADFVGRGALDRHVRQMRRVYSERREELVETVTLAAPWATIEPPAAGLHTLMLLPPEMPESRLLAAGAEADVGLFGLQTHHGARSEQHALVLGFSRPAQHRWPAALRHLQGVLESVM